MEKIAWKSFILIRFRSLKFMAPKPIWLLKHRCYENPQIGLTMHDGNSPAMHYGNSANMDAIVL